MSPRPDITTLSVALGGRGYDILIGPCLIDRLAAHGAPFLRRQKVVVISDETVAGLYLERLEAGFSGTGRSVVPIVLPPGEATKTFIQLEALCERLLSLGVERGEAIIAFGGGVIGDLAGFAAAIVRRGLGVIQVPTTLLAQVDSSVGGKTGINSRLGKNLIGAFHQPRLVVADTSLLDSLPRRELVAGYAEVVKYGLIDQPDFFAWLEAHGAAVLAGEAAKRTHAIARCCAAKAAIVAADEREEGARALLNLGHSFGHALEAEAGYDGRILHGEAVAIGCAMAFGVSAGLGLCPPGDVARLKRHLTTLGLPVHPAACGLGGLDAARLLHHMAQDKKVRDGCLTLVLARGIGEAFLARDVETPALHRLIDDFLRTSGQ
ncbi:MAG: 3-dehydroquinate synthase [Pseudomonadota bacterium]